LRSLFFVVFFSFFSSWKQVSLQSVGLNEALFEPLPPAPLPPLPRRRHTLSQVTEFYRVFYRVSHA